MAQTPARIAPANVGSYSVWDVAFPMKEGLVDLEEPHRTRLAQMLSGGRSNTLPEGLTWEDSMRRLLASFQQMIDTGTSAFSTVKDLAFLRLSMVQREHEGQPRMFFSFQAEFYDPNLDEQGYIDDMYAGYGDQMEVVWRHCEGVEDIVDGNGPAPHRLHPRFFEMAIQNRTNNTDAICFFVKNPDVSPWSVPLWQQDSEKFVRASTAIGNARRQLRDGASHESILDGLLQEFDSISA